MYLLQVTNAPMLGQSANINSAWTLIPPKINSNKVYSKTKKKMEIGNLENGNFGQKIVEFLSKMYVPL